MNTVKKILENSIYKSDIPDDELIEKEFFVEDSYRKIKKLIYEISFARIQEISELIIHKNINLSHYNQHSKIIFLEINTKWLAKSLKNVFEIAFSNTNNKEVRFLSYFPVENILNTANEIVHFGWKKEAIPITHFKKIPYCKVF